MAFKGKGELWRKVFISGLRIYLSPHKLLFPILCFGKVYSVLCFLNLGPRSDLVGLFFVSLCMTFYVKGLFY